MLKKLLVFFTSNFPYILWACMVGDTKYRTGLENGVKFCKICDIM